MAELDADLSARLSRLAAAVPVSGGELDAVHREAVRARQSVRMAWLTPLVVLVVGATVVGLLRINPFAAGGNSESTRIGDFELTISSAKAHYDVDEPIQISASLAYVGPGTSAEIAHTPGDAIGFGLIEPVLDDLVLGPASDLGGRRPRATLTAGKPLIASFRKTGGLGANEPRAQEKRAFLDDPVLRLPAGTWHPFAQVVFWETTNLEVAITLTVDVEIVVGDASANGPVVDRDADGPFSIELRSPRGTWLESEPIDVTAVMTYSGTTPAAVTAFVPLAFSIAEPVLGMEIRSRQLTDAVCPPNDEVQPGERFASPFQKAGHVTDDDPAYDAKAAWLRDPELRLPPGTWHLRVGGSLLSGSCSSAISVEAEIEIVVLADAATAVSTPAVVSTPTSTPSATEPAIRPSPEPLPDGSPFDIDRDDAFELRLEASSRSFRTDEPIDVKASYLHVGPPLDVDVWHFAPEVSYSIVEIDEAGNEIGSAIRNKIYDSACTQERLHAGVPRTVRIDDTVLMRFMGSATVGTFDADLLTGVLRLAPGRWRIHANLSTFLGGCDGEQHGLGTEIEVVVVPSSWQRLAIQTSEHEPGACLLMFAGGTLAPLPPTGIGVVGADDLLHPVLWPFAWSGWRNSDGVVLMDRDGRVVADEGDRLTWDGTRREDGTYTFCAGLSNLGP